MDVVGHYARFLFSAGLVLLAALGAFRDAPADGMPAGRVLAALANVPDRQRCDGFPQPAIQGKHPVVAVPVFSRRRHKVRHTIKELSPTNSPDRDFSPLLRGFWSVEINANARYVPDRYYFRFLKGGNGVELFQIA